FTSMITFILMANLTFKHINYNWIDYLKLHEKGMLVSLISGLILFTIKTGIKQFVMNNNGILFGTLFLFIPIFILLFLKYKKVFLGDEKEYLILMMNKFKLKRLVKYL